MNSTTIGVRHTTQVGDSQHSASSTCPDARTAGEVGALLVIDDDGDLCELLHIRFSSRGYLVSAATRGSEGLRTLSGPARYDAVVLDLRLPDGDGLTFLADIRKVDPELPVIVLTAHGTIELAVEAMRRGAFGFITKPFHDHELVQSVAHAVETTRLRREVAGLRRMVTGDSRHIVGVSRAISIVRELVARLAPTEVTVLLTGESGTGKELAARALHAQSTRIARPLIAVNCAALPADLLESELFGHVRGSFTGATRDRDGVFAAANGGTLFLDEIGDASPSVQAKLLRVLQERTFTRVGSNAQIDTNIRIVAATNRDLRADVAAGRFREDLLFRLHVVPLRMPPLRDRAEDIPILAELFLERTAAKYGRRVPTLAPDGIQAIMQHAWPGNVRELANVMEAVLLLTQEDVIHAAQLRPLMFATTERPREWIDAALDTTRSEELPPLKEVRDAVERAYLQEVLRRNDGNVSAAARSAGRTRSDFYELMRRHGIATARSRTPA